MSKSNKLLMKLIRASGGWENFLYETLRELCKDVTDLYSVDGVNREVALAILVEEAKEIIEAYVEQQGVANSMPCEKSVADVSVRAIIAPVLPVEHIKTEIKIVPPPPLQPQKMKAKVGIDIDAGWCQGELPLPAGHMIVNKGQLTVTTVTGLEMARGSEDGQVRSQDVSGQVSSKGKYRLVFKDVNLGAALINFEIMPIPPAPVEIRPPAPVQQVQITPAMVAAKAAIVEETAKGDPSKADGVEEPNV